MNRAILLLICTLFISPHAIAQYRINKKNYDYHTYSYQKGDPYNPFLAGSASFLIPGLGQMLSGEYLRGVAFAGGCTITFFGSFYIAKGIEESPTFNDKNATPFLFLSLAVVGWIAFDIWSTVDAVRVAKVNNLAFRDKNHTSWTLQIQPYFTRSYNNQSASIPIGVALRIKF